MNDVPKQVQAGVDPGSVGNFRSKQRASAKKQKLNAGLQKWMDNVLVPAMLRLYLSDCAANRENGTSSMKESVQ